MKTIEISQQSKDYRSDYRSPQTVDQIFSLFQFSGNELSTEQIEQNKKFGMFDIDLQLPERSGKAKLLYTSDKGFAGCHGWVGSAILEINGHQKPVKVKHFFSVQGSDNPEDDDTQVDPNGECQRSYDWFIKLKNMGFNVCPFFALAEHEAQGKKEKLLIMEDLSYGGTKEAIDSKRWKDQNYADKIKNAENAKAIELQNLRDGLLTHIHQIDLGNGTENIYSYDPKTNRAEVYITDVSAVYPIGRRKDSRLKNFDMSIFDPRDISKQHTQKHRLGQLLLEFVKTKLGHEDLATQNSDHDLRLAKARFGNTQMTDKILLIKLQLYDWSDDFAEYGIHISKEFLRAIDNLLAAANARVQGKDYAPAGDDRYCILENPEECKDLARSQFIVQQFVKPLFREGLEIYDRIDLNNNYYRVDIQIESKVKYKELKNNIRSCESAFIDPRTISKIFVAPQGRDYFDDNKPLDIIENPDLSEWEISTQKCSWDEERLRIVYFYSPLFGDDVSFDERCKKYKGFEIAITGKENVKRVLEALEELKNEGWKVKLQTL